MKLRWISKRLGLLSGVFYLTLTAITGFRQGLWQELAWVVVFTVVPCLFIEFLERHKEKLESQQRALNEGRQ